MKLYLTGKVNVCYEFEVTYPDGQKETIWSKRVEMGDLHSAELDVEEKAKNRVKRTF